MEQWREWYMRRYRTDKIITRLMPSWSADYNHWNPQIEKHSEQLDVKICYCEIMGRKREWGPVQSGIMFQTPINY